MKWIATDRNGDMKAFEHMPLNVKGVWVAATDNCPDNTDVVCTRRDMGHDDRHYTGTLRLTHEGRRLKLTTMFGMSFVSPEWATWAVIDRYGALYVFEHEPRKRWWGVYQSNGQSSLIGHVGTYTMNMPVPIKVAA